MAFKGEEVNVLRVLDLNAWGFQLVSSGYEEYKIRLKALQETLAGSDFDVVLLQEVWYQKDYEFLSSAFPHSASLTSDPRVLSGITSKLPGNLTPVGRSGLTILSKFPIEETEFTPYSVRGAILTFDAEFLVQKGLGRARIHWPKKDGTSLKIDLFTTHLIAYSEDLRDFINDRMRYNQALEAFDKIEKSDADIKILSGDFNEQPGYKVHQLFSSIMTDALTDKFPEASGSPDFATINCKGNTYSTPGGTPKRIDYLMYWKSDNVTMSTQEFTIPFYKTVNSRGETISLSDHEALSVKFLIE